jgi:L-rhamnose mutarotase
MRSFSRHLLSLVSLAFLAARPAEAFSPYELYLRSGQPCHVGLIAKIRPEMAPGFAASLLECGSPEMSVLLARMGISEVRGFQRAIEGQTWGVVYFRYEGSRAYLEAAAAFERATHSLDWEHFLAPHPRAERYGRLWLQMEWINFIRGRDVEGPPASSLMLGTTVIPEMEETYRTLHQTVWPGVVDQVIRGNIRNLNIFLVELDTLLVEFLYLEYVGRDEAGDDAMNKADPINQRWWKLTDACQRAFPDVEGAGPWVLLDPVPTRD